MAAVLGFYQLPDQEKVFLDYVEKSGKIIAVPDLRLRSREELKPLPLHEVIQTFNPDRMLFGLEEHANLITLIPHTGEDGAYFSVSPMNSPLISYSRPGWRGPQRLKMSNLVAY